MPDGTENLSGVAGDGEDRVIRRDPPQLGLGGFGTNAAEEHAHLGLPPGEVGAQDRGLVVVGDLGGGERLRPPAEPQLTLVRDAQVADPLGLAARRDEILLAVDDEQPPGISTDPETKGSS